MQILVTGSNGFVGKNLCLSLREAGHTVYGYDLDTKREKLDEYCAACEFVFHLAGVNRPKDEAEFMAGNFGFSSELLDTLKAVGNTCPVMLSSSTQAELDNPYGLSKLAGEKLFRRYADETGARVLIYRFPNLFGKWCRPNYNSAVATFCNNIANGLPITVRDREILLNLVYIDDLVAEMLRALDGKEHYTNDAICAVPTVYPRTLGEIVDLLHSFEESRKSLAVPNFSDGFAKALYSTYLTYLPEDAFSYALTMHSDARGSFTEIIRTAERGQFSVNVAKPGITKGNHWHHTKTEKFLVVSGSGVIRFRKPDSDNIIEYPVSAAQMQVVDIPPGYTHNIENTGDCDMVTFMWCNECFDPEHPDTFFLKV